MHRDLQDKQAYNIREKPESQSNYTQQSVQIFHGVCFDNQTWCLHAHYLQCLASYVLYVD